METAELARLVVLLIAALKEGGVLYKAEGADPVFDEITALTQLYTERTEAQKRAKFHESREGLKAIDRAALDTAEEATRHIASRNQEL